MVRTEGNRENGLFKEWWDNGQLRVECLYSNGEFHGKFKRWFDNGQLFKECTYKDGKRYGKYKRWWANGQLWEECSYENGEKIVEDTTTMTDIVVCANCNGRMQLDNNILPRTNATVKCPYCQNTLEIS